MVLTIVFSFRLTVGVNNCCHYIELYLWVLHLGSGTSVWFERKKNNQRQTGIVNGLNNIAR